MYDYDPKYSHKPFLDAAYNQGKDSVFVMFSIWVPAHVMMPAVPISGMVFQSFIKRYEEMAQQVGRHPGTMGFSIGGEMNSHPVWFS